MTSHQRFHGYAKIKRACQALGDSGKNSYMADVQTVFFGASVF